MEKLSLEQDSSNNRLMCPSYPRLLTPDTMSRSSREEDWSCHSQEGGSFDSDRPYLQPRDLPPVDRPLSFQGLPRREMDNEQHESRWSERKLPSLPPLRTVRQTIRDNTQLLTPVADNSAALRQRLVQPTSHTCVRRTHELSGIVDQRTRTRLRNIQASLSVPQQKDKARRLPHVGRSSSPC